MSASYLKLLKQPSPVAPLPAPPEEMEWVWDLRALTGEEVELVPLVYPPVEFAAATEGVMRMLGLVMREADPDDARRVLRLHLAWLVHEQGDMATLVGFACAAGISITRVTRRFRQGAALRGAVPVFIHKRREGQVAVVSVASHAFDLTPRQVTDELARYPELCRALEGAAE